MKSQIPDWLWPVLAVVFYIVGFVLFMFGFYIEGQPVSYAPAGAKFKGFGTFFLILALVFIVISALVFAVSIRRKNNE